MYSSQEISEYWNNETFLRISREKPRERNLVSHSDPGSLVKTDPWILWILWENPLCPRIPYPLLLINQILHKDTFRHARCPHIISLAGFFFRDHWRTCSIERVHTQRSGTQDRKQRPNREVREGPTGAVWTVRGSSLSEAEES